VLAAVFLMADEVEAGFRHYFPGLEFFLSHNVLSRWGTVDYSTEVQGCCSKIRKQLWEMEMQVPRRDLAVCSASLGMTSDRRLGAYEGADLFAGDHALDIAGLVQVEDDDG